MIKDYQLQHIKNLFPLLRCTGGTPEGLCFKAIMDLIIEGDNNTNKYFINFSDGEPGSQDAELATIESIKTIKRRH